jgi:hypothetical protein
MKWAIWAICAAGVWAQPLRVYSEFVTFDAVGAPAAPAQPREILSPAIVRNGFTSFQIVVQEPREVHWTLYVGQNPEDAVRVTVYRELAAKLEPVELPLSGEGVAILWMDVWADRAAPVRRIKVEPQLAVGHDWVIYPMEVRVMAAVVPDGQRAEKIEPPLIWPSVCGGMRRTYGPLSDHARFGIRNAQQDVALATALPKDEVPRLQDLCSAASKGDPESYLRIRDYLFRRP